MKLPLWSLSLWLLCVTAASAIADEPVYRFSKPVEIPALQQEELLAVELDVEVFSATDDGFPDLRLVDAEGQVVSYLLRKATTTRSRTVRKTWPGREPTLRPLEEGGLEITVGLDEKDPQAEGLCLISPLKNFEQRVRVSSSADGQAYEQVGVETVIFDYSRYMDVRSDCVSFPETAHRHFRIVVDEVTADQESELLELTRRLRGGDEAETVERVQIDRRPFRIDRVEFFREDERQRVTGDVTTEYPLRGFHVEQDEESHETLIHVDARREPLTSFDIEVATRNFSRHAAVQIEERQGVQRTWRTIGEATVSRIEFKDLDRERLEISFPETRQEKYRLVIDNRDSPPLDVTGITARGNVYELLFLAAPDKQYRIDYSADDADQPTYDTEALKAFLREGYEPARAGLGPQMEAAGGPPAFRWSRLLNDTRLLVGVILLLVIALGWGLYRASRRLEHIE